MPRFRFSWPPFVATLIAVAIGIAAGQWQSRRAEEKIAIANAMQQRGAAEPIVIGKVNSPDLRTVQEFRRVRAYGEFLAGWPVYLDNRPYQSQPGLYLVMPFRIAGTDQVVLVARGWLPRNLQNRAAVPKTPTPPGQIEIQGIVHSHLSRVYELGSAPPLQPGAIEQNLDVSTMEKASGLKLLPYVIEQSNDTQDGLIRDWPSPSFGIEKHRGYTVQWYGLALTALIFYLVTGFRRGTSKQ